MLNPLIQVPKKLRANHSIFTQWIGRLLLKLTGWKIRGSFPEEERIILVAGPHTSNWDFILALTAIFGLNVNLHWIGKHTLFKNGLSKIMKRLGGIPVNRNSPELLMNDITDIVKKYRGIIIAISPEGTRKKVTRLKSGFLRIAQETNGKIVLAGVDFSTKCIHLSELFHPTGDKDKDLATVQNYFNKFKGKRPEYS
ncbi:1-acyl-sn-glycerol-3-phosphate acyltransferase [Gammaproteobacteria bacterium]|nr:1-acyl-sn-glycerol-3-phosphate acyltransferase [Gammaproteobacteria bacterium]